MQDETARDAARDAAKYAARYVAYDSAKRIMKEPNPFSFVMDMYSMGLKPTYFRKINEEEKFVVDLPLVKGKHAVLGCYVHGDKEVLYSHQWKDYCSNLDSLKEDSSSITLV